MLARVHILLPYAFTIPEGAIFKIYEYYVGDYLVRIFPPERSEKADQHTEAKNIEIDGVRGFNADVLRIDILKNNFDRSEGSECDPPVDLIKMVANDFLARLRYVASASAVKPIEFPNVSWRITYLDDDGTKVKSEKGLIGGRGRINTEFSFVTVNNDVWEDIHSLEPFQSLPVWKMLLLDADAVLPDVGPAIVLTFTALEVFISKLLDELANSGKVDATLWAWINDRGYLKDPSIEERYDFLCSYLTGKSIKSDGDLWEQFKHLRKARNSFAHDGVAKIGGEVVTAERARMFIIKAYQIVGFIKNEIPADLRWPEFKHEIKLKFMQTLVGDDEGKG